ncbi:MAG: 3'-5' exoribonuclease [Clostridia bacterium]|nr:3'-5' exoribonuclease [Clostridia bacterium]
MTDLFGNTTNCFPAKEVKLPDFSSFVSFDIETTGLPHNSAIIEIGAVKVVNGQITECFSEFVNPGFPIPYMITQITGISDEMVKDANDIVKVLDRFRDFCSGFILVGHNALNFDCQVMRHWANEYNIYISNDVFDTLKFAKYRCEKLASLKSKKLCDLCAHFGIYSDTYHRALADADVTAKLYLEYLKL